MANEENTVTKVVEGVDKLFSQIVLNGEVVSDTRPVSTATPHTSSSTPRNRNTSPVQGEFVKAVQLNNTLHDFKDVSLTQTVSTIQENLATAQEDIDTIEAKIPSEASDQNQLADKSFVGTSIENAINELDVATVGGSGKFIESISEVDGKIVAVEHLMSSGGLAFIGTRAQYEQAKLIPEGQAGHIPSGALVCITDEDSYIRGEDVV